MVAKPLFEVRHTITGILFISFTRPCIVSLNVLLSFCLKLSVISVVSDRGVMGYRFLNEELQF